MDNGVISGGNEPERRTPFSRVKRCIILSINGWPENFPHYLTAFFTFLLGVFAFFAWIETRRGTHAIEGQLAIMRTEQAPFVWPRAHLPSPVYVDKSQQVTWNWWYDNHGKSVAYNVQTRSYIKIGDERYQLSYGLPEKRESVSLPPGDGRLATAISSPGISKEYFDQTSKIDLAFGLLMEITYSGDPAGQNVETQAVCVEALTNGLFVYLQPDHCQK